MAAAYDKPLIGIVVPVYRVKEAYLRQCVNSLVQQTYARLQIVLVDDGSPDGCGALCEQLSQGDARISVVHHAVNQGLPAARNTGIRSLDAACGWVTFVDDDDWLDPDACERFVQHAASWTQQPDIAIVSGYRNYPEAEVMSAPAYANETWFMTREEIEALQLRSLRYVTRSFPAGAINLDSACWRFISYRFLMEHELRFTDIPYREDGLFFLHSTQQARRIVYLYEPMYHYRATASSMVNMYRPHADQEHLLYLQELERFVRAAHPSPAFCSAVAYAALLSMEICITQQFFHPENHDGLLQKHRACRRYFAQAPYDRAFRSIRLRELRRSHRLKALLIRLRLYGLLPLLRDAYLLLRRRRDYE